MRTEQLSDRLIAETIRELLRRQCTMSYMNRAALRFISEYGLVRQVDWPRTHIMLTPAGRDYIAQHSEE